MFREESHFSLAARELVPAKQLVLQVLIPTLQQLALGDLP
jgi:hypothetical protein